MSMNRRKFFFTLPVALLLSAKAAQASPARLGDYLRGAKYMSLLRSNLADLERIAGARRRRNPCRFNGWDSDLSVSKL